jgi:hypothetical protein
MNPSTDWQNDRMPELSHMQRAVFSCDRIGLRIVVTYWRDDEHLVGRLFNRLVKIWRGLA